MAPGPRMQRSVRSNCHQGHCQGHILPRHYSREVQMSSRSMVEPFQAEKCFSGSYAACTALTNRGLSTCIGVSEAVSSLPAVRCETVQNYTEASCQSSLSKAGAQEQLQSHKLQPLYFLHRSHIIVSQSCCPGPCRITELEAPLASQSTASLNLLDSHPLSMTLALNMLQLSSDF